MATAEATKQSNRRRSRRRPARGNLKLECRKGGHGFGKSISTAVLDLSDTGARLIISESLDLGQEVQVTVDGYGLKGMVKRLGNVRWLVKTDAGAFCVGIEFQKSLDYREWLNLIAPN